MEDILRKAVEEILSEMPDLFLVDLLVKGNPGNQRVLIFIDGDQTFNIDQCAIVSRKLGAYLEEHEVFEGKYNLEVSSPGLDMPLAIPRQYRKNLGRNLLVETVTGEAVTGELKEVETNEILIQPKEGANQTIKFQDIKKAKVEVSFN